MGDGLQAGAVMADPWPIARQDERLAQAIARHASRLARFIRRRVPDPGEAEDILQEVFYELLAAYRATQPIDEVAAWLYRVARNRITDSFRRRAHERQMPDGVDEEGPSIEDLLPSADAGPEAQFARRVLLDEMAEALDELPPEQREVFVAHEIEGIAFNEIARRTGVNVRTLLSRKHYAVRHLRRRLRAIHDEWLEGEGE
jgi:RNA polymerase sigma factor (sigma-70 family)